MQSTTQQEFRFWELCRSQTSRQMHDICIQYECAGGESRRISKTPQDFILGYHRRRRSALIPGSSVPCKRAGGKEREINTSLQHPILTRRKIVIIISQSKIVSKEERSTQSLNLKYHTDGSGQKSSPVVSQNFGFVHRYVLADCLEQMQRCLAHCRREKAQRSAADCWRHSGVIVIIAVADPRVTFAKKTRLTSRTCQIFTDCPTADPVVTVAEEARQTFSYQTDHAEHAEFL